jgi:site-specific DNA recombinase
LNDLVWGQVIEILKHPARLNKEYERRLDMLEQGEKDRFDTATLEKQRRNLNKGKSRLIDSYADGLIDKEDFEPKIHQIKIKLQQLECQIKKCKQSSVTQLELFLVVSRLEDFAKTVNGSLGSVDFDTKREIIRALVKRVEIHKEEVVVVFRIEPESGIGGGNGTARSGAGKSIMQGCKRRTNAALWCPRCRV